MTQATPSSVPPAPGGPSSARYQGEVVYLYAFDVAYELNSEEVPQVLGQGGTQFSVTVSRREPRAPFFYRPQVFPLPPLRHRGPHGEVLLQGTVKLFRVGAISIAVHVPFEVDRIEDLVKYHDLSLSTGPLHDEVRATAERILEELRPYCIRPVKALREDEAYTVFCIRSPLPGDSADAETWLHAHRREAAALLTQEEDIARLSRQEALESTGLYLSYYEHDLSVIDWDAAVLVDEAPNFEELLHVMELANVQLVELGVFDQILDEAVDRAYRDIRKVPWKRQDESRRPWASQRDVRRDLREIRIDLDRLHDELFNTTKFFGDWHLARLYQNLSSRFHLAQWSHTIEGKLKTLDEFYQILKADLNNRLMVILEALIVLLFIIDLWVIIAGYGK